MADRERVRVRTQIREIIARGATAVLPSSTRRWLAERVPRLPVAVWDVRRAGSSYDGAYWESVYGGQDDPYGYLAIPDYYRQTLDLCGPGPHGHALEIGCSIGVFTELLAPITEELLAVDISGTAVRRTRARVARYAHVQCERRTLPAEMPGGPFDLIVCCDVLYYWPEDDLRAAAPVLAARLSPGGRLVALHHTNPQLAVPGSRVHEILREELGLRSTYSEVFDTYVLDRFDKI